MPIVFSEGIDPDSEQFNVNDACSEYDYRSEDEDNEEHGGYFLAITIGKKQNQIGKESH